MTTATPDRRAIITDALRKIDDLSARLEAAEKAGTEPIAVVGMACRFPGGVNNPEQYWELLKAGRSGIVRVPPERWDADMYYTDDHTVPGTICNREGGFLTSWQPDEFDAEFFAISPREAAAMDPQQRLLMEVACEALEDAGIPPQVIRGSQTAVFVGMTAYDYMLKLSAELQPEDLDAYIPTGNAANFAAGRLAYFLGARGPALVVDSACSSSLAAIHLACQSLRWRESDTALVGGTNLILSPGTSIACSRWGMLSPEGQCKTFDAAADGYVRSEGCGVVVLKRLADAERDGDRVLAVVRGSAVNQDGASSGVTVPNGPAQQALLRQALASSKLAAGRHRLRRGARHRHTARRPDRTRGVEPGLLRSGKFTGVGGRVGEDESRSSGGRGRHRRLHEDRAVRAPRLHPQTSQLLAVDPLCDRSGLLPDRRLVRTGLAVVGPAASGGGVVVRRQRDECARGDRAGARKSRRRRG